MVEGSLTSLLGSGLVSILLAAAVGYLILGDLPNIGSRYRKLPGAPIVGAAFSFEPYWLTRYRFSLSGWSVIDNGWKNVRSGLYTIIRPDSNITVISRKYINELANLPDEKIAAVESLVNDLVGSYTRLDILLKGHLGSEAIKRKLTPQLGFLVDIFVDELQVAAREDPLPVTSEWTEQKIGPYVSKMMARANSRLFVGTPLCRNEEWLRQNFEFVKNIFETAIVMRNIPRFLHPLVGVILPSRRRLQQSIRQLDGFLIPLIEERQAQEKLEGAAYQKPEDVIQWMMDYANEEQRLPKNLATWYEVTVLGSMSTVVEVALNCIYELCIRPEYAAPLREEIETAVKEEGGWNKQSVAKMLKTDSFMKEIFRHHPPGSLAFRRITKQEITLSDGLVLPKNTYVCVASTSPIQDPIEDADLFDGFRYYKLRSNDASPSARHNFATTDKGHIGFGHGKHACPGRFAAAVEIKMLFAHILLRYDVKLAPGNKDRPRAMRLLEFQFLDPEAVIMLRKRQ